MLQNRINITYTAAELTAFDDALTVIENLLDRVPNLSSEERSRVAKMPDGAWGFNSVPDFGSSVHALGQYV